MHSDTLPLLLELWDHLILLGHVWRRVLDITRGPSRVGKVILHYDPPLSLSLNGSRSWSHDLLLTLYHEVLGLLHAHLVAFESVLAEVLIILVLRHIAYNRSEVVTILRSRHNTTLKWFNVAAQTATVAFVDVELPSMEF